MEPVADRRGLVRHVGGKPGRACATRSSLPIRAIPDLQGARASQRATDENVPIAQASGLPSLSGSVYYAHTIEKQANGDLDFYPSDTASASTSLNAPVYSGGGVRNSVRAAKTRVEAGQASLRSTESGSFPRSLPPISTSRSTPRSSVSTATTCRFWKSTSRRRPTASKSAT
jgi:hypothetical protein